MPQQPDLAQVLLQRQQELDAAQQAASGVIAQPVSSAPPLHVGGFTFPNNVPDPESLLALLERLGYTGSRNEDIELRPQTQSVDELTNRIDALLGNR